MFINYLKELISFESITPKSAGAIEYLDKLLTAHGFKTEIKQFGTREDLVTNIYAVYGNTKPNICFVGHVDVVPAGNYELWKHDPFVATQESERIYGRGAVDMKGAIACFLAAAFDFKKNFSKIKGSISFLITSDEEGEGKFGTTEMLTYLYSNNHKINFAIIGEPTNEQQIGDTIKIGRRGSINFNLIIQGTAGHVAYPHKANNPISCLVAIMNELLELKLDEGSEYFDKSNIEITSIDTGNNISNVIPNTVSAKFNIRFNNLHSCENLIILVDNLVKKYCIKYKAEYTLNNKASSDSFIQKPEELITEFAKIVESYTQIKPSFSTSGGTSDARFVKNYCPFVEFGLLSNTAHKVNEYTKITDLQKLYHVYYNSLIKFLT